MPLQLSSKYEEREQLPKKRHATYKKDGHIWHICLTIYQAEESQGDCIEIQIYSLKTWAKDGRAHFIVSKSH